MIKICGLTDAAAVAAAVDAGADAVGFVFAKSVREIDASRAREISRQVPGGVLRIAVMLHPEQEYWQAVCETFRPDVIQTDLADFDYLDVPAEIRRWPVVREGQTTTTFPEEFVYEGSASGQGQQVNWQQAATHAAQGRMILAGGLDADNIADAIAQVAPWGVDVSSAVESVPGKKDPQKIRKFVHAASAAFSDQRNTA